MRLIIQIPCWNEEQTLPQAFAALPRSVPGFDTVETLVVDDGSTDRTVEVARQLGVTHVLSLVTHQGLAAAFQRGVLECLRLGADVVVNTDADNQYCADDIPALVAPILSGEADYVIGDRSVESLPHFSWIKKRLQRFGSYVVRVASRTSIPDTTSGFRAISRRAILQLSVHSNYTYTHETLIQAGRKDIPVVSIKVRVSPVTRPSRLFRSIPRYVLRSADTIIRIYLLYNAFRFLSACALGALALSTGLVAIHVGVTAVGSAPGLGLLVGAGALALVAFQLLLVACLADLLAVNRRLLEEQLYYMRQAFFAPAAAVEPGKGSEGDADGGGVPATPTDESAARLRTG